MQVHQSRHPLVVKNARRFVRFSLYFSLLGVFACKPEVKSAEADAILEEIQDDDYRANYQRAPGWETPLAKSDGPHGAYVDIYINSIVADALMQESLSEWPEGSVIVKDGWNDKDGQSLKFLSFMEKQGDVWFWAEYDGSDKLVAAGLDTSKCAGCHSSGADGVRAFGFP